LWQGNENPISTSEIIVIVLSLNSNNIDFFLKCEFYFELSIYRERRCATGIVYGAFIEQWLHCAVGLAALASLIMFKTHWLYRLAVVRCCGSWSISSICENIDATQLLDKL